MNYTYEELSAITLDILSQRRVTSEFPNQIYHLQTSVNDVLHELNRKVNPNEEHQYQHSGTNRLDEEDLNAISEVFWDLFRQGIVTPGINEQNNNLPWFRISTLGKKLLAQKETYFFHDLQSYEAAIRKQIPNIDATTLIYLKEAMQAFKVGCFLSSSVMLGVASEHNSMLGCPIGFFQVYDSLGGTQ